MIRRDRGTRADDRNPDGNELESAKTSRAKRSIGRHELATHVRFGDRGFEANDSALEVWLALVVREIDSLEDVPDWLRDVRDEWHLQSTAGFGFGVMPGLDRLVSGEGQRTTILGLAASALQKLEAFGPVISADALNALGTGGEGATFTSSVSASEFLRPARYFIKLLEGTLPAAESDSRFALP